MRSIERGLKDNLIRNTKEPKRTERTKIYESMWLLMLFFRVFISYCNTTTMVAQQDCCLGQADVALLPPPQR